jgi:hypothetical protein
MWNTLFRIFITIIAIIIAIIHLVSPTLTIDGITLALLLIALAPWLGFIFKSLELPGGWKIEYQDLQKVQDDVEKAGLLTSPKKGSKKVYPFQKIASEDPNLALAGLRIEIEKRLIAIAESHNIQSRKLGVGGLLRELSDARVLTVNESGSLADMTSLLNSAVHGANVDKRATDWAINVGIKLLTTLDEKIKNKK